MKKLFLAWGVAVVLFVVVLVSDFARQIILGWVLFLRRVLPELHPDGPTVAVSVGAVLLFTAGIHWFGRSWRRHVQPDGPRWKWRWTLAITVLIFLLFTSGTAMIGIVHQSGWIASSPEPMYAESPKYESDFRWVSTSFSYWKSEYMLKSFGLGLHNRNDTYGTLPAGGVFASDGTMLHGWEIETLHFIGPGYYSREIDRKLPWNHPQNARFFQCIIPEFVNPSLRGAPVTDSQGFGLIHYSANSHIFHPYRIDSNRDISVGIKLSDITDGTSTTIAFGEINANFPPWGRPMNVRDPAKGINRSPNGFGGPPSHHGANFAMADGSVRFINEKVSLNVMRALATPNAGDTVDESVLEKPR